MPFLQKQFCYVAPNDLCNLVESFKPWVAVDSVRQRSIANP